MGAIPGGIKMKLTNFAQCPDADCNGNLNMSLREPEKLKRRRVVGVNCSPCGKSWRVVVYPEDFEEEWWSKKK